MQLLRKAWNRLIVLTTIAGGVFVFTVLVTAGKVSVLLTTALAAFVAFAVATMAVALILFLVYFVQWVREMAGILRDALREAPQTKKFLLNFLGFTTLAPFVFASRYFWDGRIISFAELFSIVIVAGPLAHYFSRQPRRRPW